MKFVHRDGNSMNLKLSPDAISIGDDLVSLFKLEDEQNSSSSSSSSSGSSSEEDFFQLDPNELSKSTVEADNIPSNTPKLPPKLDEQAQLTPTFDAHTAPDHSSMTLGGNCPSAEANMHYGSIRSDQVSKVNGLSALNPGGFADNYSLLSPPIQVMGKLETPDPYRIPASVFQSKPTTPMDWSVASNESLFSIHVGNASFSRDHVFLVGRSGELGLTPDGSPPTSVILESEPNFDFGEGLEAPRMPEVAANAETMEEILRAAAAAVADVNEKAPNADARLSDASGTSALSFAFPILEGGEKIGSMKTESKRLQKHRSQLNKLRSHDAIPTAAKTKWFTCFGHCSLCC